MEVTMNYTATVVTLGIVFLIWDLLKSSKAIKVLTEEVKAMRAERKVIGFFDLLLEEPDTLKGVAENSTRCFEMLREVNVNRSEIDKHLYDLLVAKLKSNKAKMALIEAQIKLKKRKDLGLEK